jgi:hypothetical protein
VQESQLYFHCYLRSDCRCREERVRPVSEWERQLVRREQALVIESRRTSDLRGAPYGKRLLEAVLWLSSLAASAVQTIQRQR